MGALVSPAWLGLATRVIAPPPALFGGAPSLVREQARVVEAVGVASLRPAVATTFTAAWGPQAVADVRGQLGLTHGTLSAGVTLRNQGTVRFGARTGLGLGLGSVAATRESTSTSYVGPALHLQLGWPGRRGSWSTTVGVEDMMVLRGSDYVGRSFRKRTLWTSFDVRHVHPLERVAVVWAAALHVSLPGDAPREYDAPMLAPTVSVGLRLGATAQGGEGAVDEPPG